MEDLRGSSSMVVPVERETSLALTGRSPSVTFIKERSSQLVRSSGENGGRPDYLKKQFLYGPSGKKRETSLALTGRSSR